MFPYNPSCSISLIEPDKVQLSFLMPFDIFPLRSLIFLSCSGEVTGQIHFLALYLLIYLLIFLGSFGRLLFSGGAKSILSNWVVSYTIVLRVHLEI